MFARRIVQRVRVLPGTFSPSTVHQVPHNGIKLPVKSIVGGLALAASVYAYKRNPDPARHTIGVIQAAAAGLFGIDATEQDKGHDFKDPHRQIVHSTVMAEEVRNVNLYCSQHCVPLSAVLAILFIMQNQMAADKGSAMDLAFEKLIIAEFLDEYKSYNEEDRKKINENVQDYLNQDEVPIELINLFNSIGIIAHTGYFFVKAILRAFEAYVENPNIVNQERYGNRAPRSQDVHAQVEIITELITSIANELQYISTEDTTRYKAVLHASVEEHITKIKAEQSSKLYSSSQQLKDQLHDIKTSSEEARVAPKSSEGEAKSSPSL